LKIKKNSKEHEIEFINLEERYDWNAKINNITATPP